MGNEIVKKEQKTLLSIKEEFNNENSDWAVALRNCLPDRGELKRFLSCCWARFADPKNGSENCIYSVQFYTIEENKAANPLQFTFTLYVE